MQKIKTFFITLFRTFTDPAYYNDVLKASGSFSFKYFSLFYALLSLLSVGILSATTLRTLPTLVDSGIDTARNWYPENLEVTFDTTKSEITVAGAPEPIIIPLPDSENVDTTYKNFFVLDTSATSDDFEKYHTIILLTKTQLISVGDEGRGNSYQVLPLTDITESLKSDESGRAITSLTLNKSFVESNIPMVKQMAHKAIQMAPFFLLPLFVIGFILSRLAYLTFMSLLTMILSNLAGKNISYGKMFQIGLHTITVTDGITKLQQVVFQSPMPSLYSFAFLGITFIALLGITTKLQKTSAS
jgi:hypothetical protein